MFIYHITSVSEWESSSVQGGYLPANFATDGFIHCSFRDQVIPVVNRYYKNTDHLVLLQIDTEKVIARIIEENLEGGDEKFPHIYGSLPASAVDKSAPMTRDQNGYYTFPAQLD